MSNSILKRNSSKQGLQNLLRVTAQRSVEDAEEIERERRRRARERQQGQGLPLRPTGPALDNGLHTEGALCDSELKSGCQVALEEDEGFSDWTQRLEKHKQRHIEEQEARDDRGLQFNGNYRPSPKSDSVPNEHEEEWERSVNRKTQDVSKTFTDDKVTEKTKEVRISYTSKVFMPQDTRHLNTTGDGVERTTYLVAGKLSPRSSSSLADQVDVDGEVADDSLEAERRLEKIRRSHAEKERQELEELKQRQVLEQQELEELNSRRGDRRRLREEEECRMEEEKQHKQMEEVEERQKMREEIERRRMAATERRLKNLSVSSNEGEDHLSPFIPMSPTFKKLLIQFYPNEMEERVTAENTCTINERTESLNRSLKKSNSLRKTLPPVAVSKIDNRLEQYTQAIEISTKEAKAAKQALMDLPSPTEPVAAKKNLFEAGDAWGQCSTKGTPSKDPEGIKVGVANLITQWVRGSSDGSCKNSSSKPAEIKPGDVLNKKNLWENLGDTSSSGRGERGASGKRYKYVVTGHGKYEKVPVTEDYDEYSN
ncbi:non-muscle caldesmon-like isoform X3 [Hypomesus transpacificus]|uniref:non-muscle caldesmon-like isoform X3 n=1 Tax=Hypomesus transpacificus TaxID=137520 RepID=UPI001F07C109|nr:non-muscle caldesmon-like isoform X3 [Hypomesus transpacificus]